MLNTITIALSLMTTTGGVPTSDADDTEPPARAVAPDTRDTPLALGEKMPAFTLTDPSGVSVSLTDALAKGPVVVTFYRGAWCPYCISELKSLEQSVGDINALGATVYAISPQTPEHAIDMREQTGLSYELLVDQDNQLARKLGLMFTLDDATVKKYRKYGIDVPASNGTDSWQLPIPATYVLDTDGTVRYAWTDEDYTKRAPVGKILDTLRSIRSDG